MSTNTGLFNQNDQTDEIVIDPNTDYYETLVGEGKKYVDQKALARAVLEKEAFIQRLQSEAKGLRQDLNTRITLEEYLDKMGKTSETQAGNNSMNNQSGDDYSQQQENKGLKPEDIESLIEKKVSEREQARIQSQNIQQVQEALTKSFGLNYVSKLDEAAKALGMTRDEMQILAANKPKAFLHLVGIQEGKRDEPSSLFVPPSSVTNTNRTDSVTSDRTKAYYDKLKTTDPKMYWTPKIQNQMHNDAIRLGERFFDK